MPTAATPISENAPSTTVHIGAPARSSKPADALPAALAIQVSAVIKPAEATDSPARCTSSVGSRPAIAMNWNV
jgi:hypothetical protein